MSDMRYATGYHDGMSGSAMVAQHSEVYARGWRDGLRTRYVRDADNTAIAEILEAAFEEDDREDGRFDEIGLGQFCPEHDPDDVREAWALYKSYRLQVD